MMVNKMQSDFSTLYQTVAFHSTAIQQLQEKVNNISNYLQSKDIPSGKVTNTMITSDRKSLQNDVMFKDPSEKENDEQSKAKRKRYNDDEPKTTEIVAEKSKANDWKIISVPSNTIPPYSYLCLTKKGENAKINKLFDRFITYLLIFLSFKHCKL